MTQQSRAEQSRAELGRVVLIACSVVVLGCGRVDDPVAVATENMELSGLEVPEPRWDAVASFGFGSLPDDDIGGPCGDSNDCADAFGRGLCREGRCYQANELTAPGAVSPVNGSATLVSPSLVLTARHLISGWGHWDFGHITERPYPPEVRPEDHPYTRTGITFRFGFDAVAPFARVVGVRCWEFRSTGMHECCDHPTEVTAGLGMGPPWIVLPEEEWDTLLPRQTTYTYRHYRNTCPDPITDPDTTVSDAVLFELETRFGAPELGGPVVSPFRMALDTPDGSGRGSAWIGLPAQFLGFGVANIGTFPFYDRRRLGYRQLGDTFVTEPPTPDDPGLTFPRPEGSWLFAISVPNEEVRERSGGGDSGGPLLVTVGGEEFVVGAGSDGFDSWGSWFHVLGAARAYLDPDGDGRHRGELDSVVCADVTDPACCSDIDHDCIASLDNCPTVANLDQRDTDGDGVGDACDVCPDINDPAQLTCVALREHPGRPSRRALGVGLPPIEAGDVIGRACSGARRLVIPDIDRLCGGAIDSVRTVCEDQQRDYLRQEDRDEDGVPDLCDNCLDIENPDQRDRNGNGVGDECEPDTDRDGYTDDIDNCRTVRNPDQLNCNREVEQLRGLAELGDACDDVPCVDVRGDTHVVEDEGAPEPFRLSTASIVGPGSIAGLDGALFRASVETGLRVCPCPALDDGSHELCAALGCDRTPPDSEFTNLDSAWKPPLDSWLLPEHPLPDGDYGDTAPVAHYRGDREPDLTTAWNVAEDPAVALFRTETPFGASVRAMVWSSGRSFLNCDGRPCPTGHDRGGRTWSTPSLASHFLSGSFGTSLARLPFPDASVAIPLPLPEPICLECWDAFPLPFLAEPLCVGPECPTPPDWHARFGVRGPVVDLRFPQITPQLSEELARAETAFIVAQEPRELLGAGAILAVGLEANVLVAQVTRVGSRLGLVGERPCPPQQCGNNLVSGLRTATAASDTEPYAPPFPLLLGNQHELVRLGGSSDYDARRISYTALDTGWERAIRVTGDRPREVLAAAVGVAGGEALVLDRYGRTARHGRRPRDVARLLLVDLDSGTSRRLETFPWLGLFDTHHLVAMADGDYALVASSARLDRHVVFRLRIERRGVRVVAVDGGRGTVLSTPAASLDGVSLAVAREGTWAPIGYYLTGPGRGRRLGDCF